MTSTATPAPELKMDIKIVIALTLAVIAFLGLIYYIYTSAAGPTVADVEMEAMTESYSRPRRSKSSKKKSKR